MELLKRLVVEEEGQGITEYALIVGLVVLGIWIAVDAADLGGAITNLFNRITGEVNGCTSGSCP
jgi:pilus assembly protein Flp/PilA